MKSNSRFRGPSPILPAAAHILIFVASMAAAVALRQGTSFVTPFAPAEALRSFLAQNHEAMRVSNFFIFGSAVPLGIFAVVMVSRLRDMGVRAAGTNVALLGGLIATIALILCGAVGWVLTVPDVLSAAALVKAMSFLNFLLGGVIYAVGFGLLAAGISMTGYFTRVLPRWLVVFGMLLAVAGELSWFSLLAYPANYFIPITRYIGFIWMILAAVALRKDRRVADAIPTEADAV